MVITNKIRRYTLTSVPSKPRNNYPTYISSLAALSKRARQAKTARLSSNNCWVCRVWRSFFTTEVDFVISFFCYSRRSLPLPCLGQRALSVEITLSAVSLRQTTSRISSRSLEHGMGRVFETQELFPNRKPAPVGRWIMGNSGPDPTGWVRGIWRETHY